MGRILVSDLIKIRKKMIWFLVFFGPFGVIGLEALNFGIRYDYLTQFYKDDLWKGLLENVQAMAMPALMLGLTIVASMIANIEHQTNAWKQLIALPISKKMIFTGKFSLAALLLFASSTLLLLGTIILGIALKFGTDFPIILLLKISYYPFLAIMPFIALQIWLSIIMKNQAISLTIGIVGTVLSLYSTVMPDWMPYKWPTLINDWGGPIYSVIAGLVTGLAVYLLGLMDFVRKDVK
ncbi:ABC transporter permease [Bacillus sp. 03113]|uniref:ABC transporter permease n=1 Tax=Bacillus sp. 03113 TaxID=2578211 RepID=UPI001141CACE|nr:ABC transporter permease [Bacillus sp. 03113]